MNNQIKQASTAQVCNYTITLSVKWVFVLIRNCQTLHCCYWAKHLSINLTIFNQVFVQSECRMKVCVFSVLFPVLLCVVIQWHGGNIASVLSSFHRSVCLCFCVSVCLAASGFSHKLVAACLAATSEVGSVYAVKCVHVCCVWGMKSQSVNQN